MLSALAFRTADKLTCAMVYLSLIISKQCIIKQLLDSVFVISRIIKVSVGVISLGLPNC